MHLAKTSLLSSALLMALVFSIGACGSDEEAVGNTGDLVGGSCEVTSDCDERCVRNGDFPQGLCTVSCTSDQDCPNASNCIDKEGGICALSCDEPSDCRGGYTCKGETNLGHGGDSLVCIAD